LRLRVKQRLALDEWKLRDVPIGQVQKFERVMDEMHIALAVGCGLRLRKTRQSAVVNAAELAVDIGGLHIEVRECTMALG
jgi:hypothetical protein